MKNQQGGISVGLFDIVGEAAGLLVKGTGLVLNGLTRVVTGVDVKEEYEKRKDYVAKYVEYKKDLEENAHRYIEEWGYDQYCEELNELPRQLENWKKMQQNAIECKMYGKLNDDCKRIYGDRLKEIPTRQLKYMFENCDYPEPLRRLIYNELCRR